VSAWGQVPGPAGPAFLTRAAALVGLDVVAVGPENFRRAADQAMLRLSLDDRGEYLSLLTASPVERRLLAGEAVVQESWLFRDPEALAGLAELAQAAGAGTRTLRALSVPCATGEEPASIAVTLFEAGAGTGRFQVDAADANPKALAQGRTGRFGPGSVRGGPSAPGPFFRPDGQDLVLCPEVLARIRFIEADVLDDSFLAGAEPYQAIFCSHLLIYLSLEARARLANTLKRLLGSQGVLFTSAAEAAAFASLGLAPWPRRATAWPARFGAGPVSPPPPARPGPAARADALAPASTPASTPASMAGQACEDLALVQALADAGRIEEALVLVEAALGRGVHSAGLYHLKGAALLAHGRGDEAEAAFRRAVYLEPGHVESLTHLELLSRARGRPDEAERWAGRADRAEADKRGGQIGQVEATDLAGLTRDVRGH
jgi:chemotaxis protein methyltransferase WspC